MIRALRGAKFVCGRFKFDRPPNLIPGSIFGLYGAARIPESFAAKKFVQAPEKFSGIHRRFALPVALPRYEEDKSQAGGSTSGSVPPSAPLENKDAVLALVAASLVCLLQKWQTDETRCMEAPPMTPGSGATGGLFFTPVKARVIADSNTAMDLLKVFLKDQLVSSSGNPDRALSEADGNVLFFLEKLLTSASIVDPEHLQDFTSPDDISSLSVEKVKESDVRCQSGAFRGVKLLKDYITTQLAQQPLHHTQLAGADPMSLLSADPPTGRGLLTPDQVAPGERVQVGGQTLSITLTDPRVEQSTSSLDAILDKMCQGSFREPVQKGTLPVIPQGIATLPALMQPPRQVVDELQRRANTATERKEAYFPGNTLHPRFAPQYMNSSSMVKQKGDGYYPQWGGFVNFSKALEIFGNALQCVVQPQHILYPGTPISQESAELVPIIPPGAWQMYLYRIAEIQHRFSSGTAMRYDTAFRAQLAHRCSVGDASVVISQEIVTIDRQLLDVAHAAAITSQEEQKLANKSKQRSVAQGIVSPNTDPRYFSPWSTGKKGKGKGRLRDSWNSYSSLGKDGSSAVASWSGGKASNRGKPYGGFPPMVTPPGQGPFLPQWQPPAKNVPQGNAWNKGKGREYAPF